MRGSNSNPRKLAESRATFPENIFAGIPLAH
jgi:hypothetical protein